jgi:hypothetical protein
MPSVSEPPVASLLKVRSCTQVKKKCNTFSTKNAQDVLKKTFSAAFERTTARGIRARSASTRGGCAAIEHDESRSDRMNDGAGRSRDGGVTVA